MKLAEGRIWLRRLFCYIGLGSWLIFVTLTAESTERYRFDFWTADEGIPQNSVYSIIQTRDGYLWFTTLDGLARYDGVRFTVFNKGNTEGINSNRFNLLFEDNETGDLWAGTEEGGLTRLHNGKFKTYTTADGLPGNWIVRIQKLHTGELLFTTKTGLVQFKDEKFTPFPLAANYANKFLPYVDSFGNLWYADNSAIHQITGSHRNIYPLPTEYLSGLTLQFYEDFQGEMWVAARKSSFYHLKDGIITEYGGKKGLPRSFLAASFKDQNGNFYFAGEAGIVRFAQNQYSFLSLKIKDREGNLWFAGDRLFRLRGNQLNAYTTNDGLSSNYTSALLEDREGNLWIGTGDRGLNRLTKQTIITLSRKDGMSDDNIYPIFEDSKGRIWFGSSRLMKYENGKFTNYSPETTLGSKIFQSFYEDKEGRLWIGWMGGVGWLKNDKFTDFTGKIYFRFSNLWVIYQDSEGNFWFGTDSGLIKFKDNVSTVYTIKDGLPDNDVKVIHEDRAGNLWFGTAGGIAVLKENKFTTYTTKDGLTSNFVRSMTEDADGTLWIGTYDRGLSRFKDGKFTNYTIANGLFNNGVFSILEDGRNNFWISSNRGIYRVSKRQLNDFADGKIRSITSVSYSKHDGMLNAECNGGRQPSAIKARDGRLWFPTQQGAAIINPETVPFNENPPPVVIEDIIIDRETIDWRSLALPVEVAPDKTNVEIHYTGLSFVKPEHILFRYRLEGLDADWVEAGNRRAAYYAHLPPGEYTFRVIAANSDGIWNEHGATIRLRIIPPFYRTWWFIVLWIVGIIGLISFIYHRRISLLQKEKAAQESFSRRLMQSQEHERERIAAELHDGLSQSLVIIKNRAMLSLTDRENVERAFEQLEEISEAASEAMLEAKEIIYDLRPIQLDRFGLTKAVKAMIKKVSEAHDINFITDIDLVDGLLAKEAESSFYRILQESVNNVVRHSGATQAKVSVKKQSGFIKMTVKDNGKGFLPELSKGDENYNGGFGLIGIVERARLLKGEAEIQSELGKGTSIKISVPIEKDFSGN